MTSPDKTLDQILRGLSDANIAFGGLRTLLRKLGFSERIRGSHHIFFLFRDNQYVANTNLSWVNGRQICAVMLLHLADRGQGAAAGLVARCGWVANAGQRQVSDSAGGS